MSSRSNFFHDVTIRVAKLANIVLMTAPFAFAWYTFYADKLWVNFYMRGHWMVIALYRKSIRCFQDVIQQSW